MSGMICLGSWPLHPSALIFCLFCHNSILPEGCVTIFQMKVCCLNRENRVWGDISSQHGIMERAWDLESVSPEFIFQF